MKVATRFEIFYNVRAGRDPVHGWDALDVPEKPLRVATLINEEDFLKNKELSHHRNVFLEDRVHDWDWHDGQLRYYSRVAAVADVVVVYEQEDV